MYVKVTNGTVDIYPYSIGQLIRDYPNTSFPKVIPDSMLQDYGIYPVVRTDMPNIDESAQSAVKNETPTLVDGSWTLGWSIENKTAEETTAFNIEKANENRVKRNILLGQSDWTQMNDSPLSNEDKTAWATYRQNLRDLPTNDNWPNLTDSDWPTKP